MKQYLKIVIPVVAVLLFAVIGCLQPIIHSKQIKENYAIVESNFNSIKNLPGAELVKTENWKKSNLVSIHGDFRSNDSYEGIKAYYMNELKNEGWEFVSESIPKEWGKDKGYKELDFKKDEMVLELFYNPKDNQEYSFDYYIAIRWEF